MAKAEDDYLELYRTADAKKMEVQAWIGALREMCRSLGDWHALAASLAGSSVRQHANTAWSDDRIGNVIHLRGLLIEYHNLYVSLNSMWSSKLTPETRKGLSHPSTLIEPPAS